MIYAYRGRNGKLCIRPADPEGEDELREILKELRQNGMEAIDIETEMPDHEYNQYQRQRYGYGQGKQSFGFAPQSYMPQPPDFNPQSHHMPYPIIFPVWLDRYNDNPNPGPYRDRSNVTRMDRGEYDGRENPRETGPRDTPRR